MEHIQRIYNLETLQEMAKLYQGYLRLKDWNIEVVFIDQRDLEGRNAEVEMMHKKQFARIKICSAESWAPGFTTHLLDMKYLLLHEMVHMLFSRVHPDQLNPELNHTAVEYDLFELAIDKMASVLAELLPELPEVDMEASPPDDLPTSEGS